MIANYFRELVDYTSSMLQFSYSEIQNRFSDYPLCLMNYVEKDINERMIEIRFDNKKATISCLFNKQDKCNATFLFFDCSTDEDLFISYLTEKSSYNFRKCSWIMENCYAKVNEENSDIAFVFYK